MRYLLPILLICLSFPALATEKKTVEESVEKTKTEHALQVPPDMDEDLLKDWIGLNKLLRSHGIHSSQVNWRVIEEICLGLRNEKDNRNYNRCRLNKAIDQVEYRNHSAECNQEASATFPDRLLQYTPEAIITGNKELPEGTELETNQFVRVPISTKELRNKRAVVFRACMRSLGWVDPNNWRKGTR